MEMCLTRRTLHTGPVRRRWPPALDSPAKSIYETGLHVHALIGQPSGCAQQGPPHAVFQAGRALHISAALRSSPSSAVTLPRFGRSWLPEPPSPESRAPSPEAEDSNQGRPQRAGLASNQGLLVGRVGLTPRARLGVWRRRLLRGRRLACGLRLRLGLVVRKEAAQRPLAQCGRHVACVEPGHVDVDRDASVHRVGGAQALVDVLGGHL
eukprot:scaffold87447_cov67-Phaeocystis_antarctica.AAC.4